MESEDTGQHLVALGARGDDNSPVCAKDVAPIARELATWRLERARISGATWALRGIAALLILIAQAMGARALQLAGEAAEDHHHVARLREDVGDHETALRDLERSARDEREATRVQAQEARGLLDSTKALLDRVERQVERVEERVDALERRGRGGR